MASLYGGGSSLYGGGSSLYGGNPLVQGTLPAPLTAAERKQLKLLIAQRAALPQPHHGGPFASLVHHLTHNVVSKGIEQVGESALNTPGAFYNLAKPGVEDIASATTGDLNFDRSRHFYPEVGKAMVHQTIEDFRHPLAHPGYVFLDTLGLVSLGVGTAARLAAASRIAKVAEMGDALRGGTYKFAPRVERSVQVEKNPATNATLSTKSVLIDKQTGGVITPEQAAALGGEEGASAILSRSPAINALQRGAYKFHVAHPDMKLPIRGVRRGTLADRMAFESDEVNRVANSVVGQVAQLRKLGRAAGYLDEQQGLAQHLDHQGQLHTYGGANSSILGRSADFTNQLAQIALLYTKPGYVPPNVLGQILLTLQQHSFNPISIARTLRVQRHIYGDGLVARKLGMEPGELAGIRAAKIKGAMQESSGGILSSAAPEAAPGLFGKAGESVTAVHGFLGNVYNKIIDTPFRDNAFITEAYKMGYKTPEAVAKLIDDGGEKFMEAARRGNREMIDYARLGPRERAFWRRAIFFYPWIKGATIYGGHYLLEHPVQATAQLQQGHMQEGKSLKELGPLPSYLAGAFKVGETNVPGVGKEPTVINPTAATILGQTADTWLTALEAIQGGKARAFSLPEQFSPALGIPLTAITHRDYFTGKDYPANMSIPAVGLAKLSQTVDPTFRYRQLRNKREAVLSGKANPQKVLLPDTANFNLPGFGKTGEPDVQFFTGLSPRTLNQGAAATQALKESRLGLNKVQAEIARHKDYLKLYHDKAIETGVLPQGQKLPPEVTKAFTLRARAQANQKSYQEASGKSQLSQVDRLDADLRLLVKMKVLTQSQRAKLLRDILKSGAGEEAIRRIRRAYGDAYFGAKIISNYKSILNSQGAQITVP